jgi:retron-type reverse transcriptase
MTPRVSFKRLISCPNLEFAWRRITTGANHQHKRYFRELYYAYEIALDANLKDLHERLRGGSYRPQAPIRVYLPKPSGLQRPLTLLTLEDQLVLQAVANCIAVRLAPRRRPLELRTIFSNVLQKQEGSIFFFYDWHQTYYKFKKKLQVLFNAGLRWTAHFDLAAFYDTISHDLLLRTAFPREQLGEDGRKILEWFKTWSTERQTSTYGHGIPQGPIASDFLAECFLLPIDEVLKDLPYVRYVDDIRIFGSSESEVRKSVLRLELLCRERGLIPQGKKFAITEVASLEDALGMLPSLAPPNNEEDPERLFTFNATDGVEHFESALAQDTRLITDKARARYVLYRAEPSPPLLRHVLRLLPK